MKKIILLDWDDTLAPQGEIRLYQDTIKVLDWLRSHGHTLVLFSGNGDADEYAARTGVMHMFDVIAAGHFDNTKEWNWQRVQRVLRANAKNTVLFDDQQINIDAHRARGGFAYCVGRNGIRFMDLRAMGL